MKNPSNVLFLRLLYFLIYFGDALFTPFYGLYLLSLGFSALSVSIVLGVIPFSACLGSLLLGRLGTSFRRNVLWMKILCGIEAVGVILLAFLTSYGALIVTAILLAFANGVYYQIEDSASSYAFAQAGKSFQSVRIFGSLGFLSALVVCYFLLQYWAYRWIFVLAAGIFISALALMFFLKDYPEEGLPAKTKESGSWKALFQNRSFVFFFLFYFLLDGSISIQGYILPLYLNQLGLSDSVYSLLNAFRVGLEVVAVFFYGPIKKLFRSDRNCLLAGGGILFLSCLSIVVIPNAYGLAIANYACRGLGGALLFIGFVDYLSQILPHPLLTRGLAVCSAAMDIFTGSINFASSSIYESTSFLVFFAILCGIALLGYVFLFFTKNEGSASEVVTKEKV
jgi:PPP family 3-phenylpropionic acid transporter